jgi:transglutaminase-like putative cysteine protease
MLLVNSNIDPGQVITEDVAQPNPTIAELRGASGEPDPALADYLRLPAITAYVRDKTATIVANAHTPYERARAISNFFAAPRNGFTYSLQTATGDSGDQLTDFLRNRVGYCQQFAASMAVMLRLAGVPSRVVLGYAHSVPDDQGQFTVTTFDAHAWVEANFAGIGWVPFDPTPLSGLSGGAASDLVWAPHGKNIGNIDPVRRPTASVSRGPDLPSAAPTKRAAATASSGISLVLPLTVLVVLVVLGAVALTPAWVRWRRRRRRVHQIRRGNTDALWAELADTTVDLGYVWSDARTPRQVARWLGNSSDSASGSLQTLTAAVERARYSSDAGDAGSDLGSDLAGDLAQVRAGLGMRRSPRERMKARFWPASLDWSRLRWIGRWLPGSSQRRH